MSDGTRSRVEFYAVHQSPYQYNGVDGSSSAKPALIKTACNQTTYSLDNPWYLFNKKLKNLRGMDIGGPFFTERFRWEPEFPDDKYWTLPTRNTGLKQDYRGGHIHAFSPNSTTFNNIANRSTFASDSVMDSWGTSAISSVIPTKAPVELATTAAELISGGLPKLLGAGLLKSVIKDHRKVGSHVKSGADEFLNYQFGIAPLISDIQATAKSIVTAAERIQQLERDSGRLVRRQFRFPLREEVITSKVVGTSVYPPGWSYTYLWDGLSGHTRETHNTYRVNRWFSGAFTYHLDLGSRHRDALYAAADNARLLLGLKLDADVLWNLMPWSWLADWFGNVGDIATNISHFSRDGLVMPYGYVMSEQHDIQWVRLSKLNWFRDAGPSSVTDSVSYIRKQRRAAHPYGFGLSDMVLDTRQTAILSALGISKAPRR